MRALPPSSDEAPTVVTTEVTDGLAGVDPNPNRTGGSTGRSSPRSSSSQAPVQVRIARTSVAPYHSRRPWPAVPRVRTPRSTTRATGSTAPANQGAVATGAGMPCSSHPSAVRRPKVRERDSGPASTRQWPSAAATATGASRTSSKV